MPNKTELKINSKATKPKASSTAAKPKVSSNTTEPKANPKATKLKASSNAAKPKASTKAAKPKVNPNAGHRGRLRTRLLEYPRSLEDYELLELLLAYIYPRKDTKPMAKETLLHFSNLRGLLDARYVDLEVFAESKKGIVVAIMLFREVMARYAESPLIKKQKLADAKAVAQMARARMGKLEHEECWIVLVDIQNNVLNWEMILRGSTSEVQIRPKDVLTLILKYNCYGFMLVHNHPAGSVNPSTPDIAITRKIKELAQTAEIKFLDHIIVTENDWYSFNDNGIL